MDVFGIVLQEYIEGLSVGTKTIREGFVGKTGTRDEP